MKIVPRADYRRMPWKNGGGLTEEVAVHPPGSTVESFDWRLSIAHIAADGPFSAFPGVDRTLALLDGPGLALDLPDGRTAELTRTEAPFSFPGEWTISSRILGGPSIDFNVMTRRGRCGHRMQRVTLRSAQRFIAPARGWAVFDTAVQLEASGKALQLARFDTLALDEADEILTLAGPASFLWTTIER